MTGFNDPVDDFLKCMAGEADETTRRRTEAMLTDPNGSWNRERTAVLANMAGKTTWRQAFLRGLVDWIVGVSTTRKYAVAAAAAAVLLLCATFAGLVSAEHDSRHVRQHLDVTIQHYTQIDESMRALNAKHHSGRLTPTQFELESAKISGAIHGELSRLRTLPAYSSPQAGDNSAFVADGETFPDGTKVAPGATFEKVWVIRNSGSVPWHRRYVRRAEGGGTPHELRSEAQTPLPSTEPGMNCRIAVKIIAPERPGAYYAEWKMVDEHGRYLLPGKQPLYVLVQVE